MFTGIIEEIGIIKSFKYLSNGAEIQICCNSVLKDTKIGDSICVNGVCETVTNINSDNFYAKISDETLAVTDFKNLKIGDYVNLERALTLNSRLGGHIVTGHVDCVGELINIKRLNEFYDISIKIPNEQRKYVVHKGSITINGISLTVAEISGNVVKIALIPHTFNNTTFKNLKIKDYVNIETDILGKYVEKMLSANDNKENRINMKFLEENGFV